MQEAGKQLLRLRVEQCRITSSSDADRDGNSMDEDGQGAADAASQHSNGSSPASSFRDYGYEDSHDGTSMHASSSGDEEDDSEKLRQVWVHDSGRSWGHHTACTTCGDITDEEEYDREANEALGLTAAADSNADEHAAAGVAAAAAGDAVVAVTVSSSAADAMAVDVAPHGMHIPEAAAAAHTAEAQAGFGMPAAAGGGLLPVQLLTPAVPSAVLATAGAAGGGTAGAAGTTPGAKQQRCAEDHADDSADAAGPADADNSSGSADPDSELLSDLDTEDGDEAEVQAADAQALNEIRHYQSTSHKLLSKRAFARIVIDDIAPVFIRGIEFDPLALEALQRAAEDFLVDVFDCSMLCAVHAKRQKVRVEDIRLGERLTEGWRRSQVTNINRGRASLVPMSGDGSSSAGQS